MVVGGDESRFASGPRSNLLLAYVPKLRFEDCPTECDIEGCEELGCATPAAPSAEPEEAKMREKHRFQRGGRVIDQMCGLCSAIADAEIHQMGDIERAQSKTVGATPSTETQQCIWTYDPDGYWQTSCGDQFCISDGTPAENKMRFCHYCGLRLEVKRNSHFDPNSVESDTEVIE